jgi:hypothetical protein
MPGSYGFNGLENVGEFFDGLVFCLPPQDFFKCGLHRLLVEVRT